jgi:hypothetical protein
MLIIVNDVVSIIITHSLFWLERTIIFHFAIKMTSYQGLRSMIEERSKRREGGRKIVTRRLASRVVRCVKAAMVDKEFDHV